MFKQRGVAWACLAMAVLILDSKTALLGAQEGITLCLRSIIPALFPFSVISLYICGNYTGKGTLLARFCRIPQNAGTIPILGFLGGYPVGIQCVSQSFRQNALQKQDAERMAAFCSNPGPAFIFGMAGSLFPSMLYPAAMMAICVISAITVGHLLPGESNSCGPSIQQEAKPFLSCVEKAAASMVRICTWVILFRILLTFCSRWFLFALPPAVKSIFYGALELTSGILSTASLPTGLRFMLCCVCLCFGGLCVWMQSKSIATAAGLTLRYYLPGKLLQSMIALLLAHCVQCFFPEESIPFSWPLALGAASAIAVLLLLLRWRKKVVEKNADVQYNTEKSGGYTHGISEKDSQTVPVLSALHSAG